MKLLRLAAFSMDDAGGNPAGVCLLDQPMPEAEMARIAADVGYSETAFAYRDGEVWRTRYFSPESEVPFCGHATIALGAALCQEHGGGRYDLRINNGDIMVEGERDGALFRSRLSSPPSSHSEASDALIDGALTLFGWDRSVLAPGAGIGPALVMAGARHLLLPLADRETLATMTYDLDAGRTLMRAHDLTTISLVWRAGEDRFVARNAFASGGVLEDPATGAAAAALAGYLRDAHGPAPERITILQGEDMGSPSQITVEIPPQPGSPLFVSGTSRMIDD